MLFEEDTSWEDLGSLEEPCCCCCIVDPACELEKISKIIACTSLVMKGLIESLASIDVSPFASAVDNTNDGGSHTTATGEEDAAAVNDGNKSSVPFLLPPLQIDFLLPIN